MAVALERCGACLRDPPPFERCVCACDCAFPWDQLITAFKFQGHVELAAPLAQCMLQALHDAHADMPDLLIPVPLAPGRLAERGYNQSWELAHRLGRAVHRPAASTLLERPGDGAHQADLPLAQRLTNLRGAFVMLPAQRARLRQRHVALVDDVMSSGATLREAASTLLRAGAARVDAWVLARTPQH
jgi:ComF family protein